MNRWHPQKKVITRDNYLPIIYFCLFASLFFLGNKMELDKSESPKDETTPRELFASESNVSENARETKESLDEEETYEDEGSDTTEDDEEIEKREEQITTSHQIRYTADISDEMLQKLFAENPSALGSISVGFANLGRLINGVKFPQGDEWVVINPAKSYGTQEVVNYIIDAARSIRKRFPDAPPLRINDLSLEKGGYIRPHKSHQNGRDVDIGFFWSYDIKNPNVKRFDVEKNWEFIKAIITLTDVEVILVDRKIQKQLYDYAKGIGENEDWLNSIFKSEGGALIKHARRHRGHFHIRFYSPRAQELGKRIHPILDKAKEEERVTIHKVKWGECIGKIAAKYNSSIKLIKNRNHLKSNNIKAGMILVIPLLGPCHNCPEPSEVIIPKRRLPEDFMGVNMAFRDHTHKENNTVMVPLNYYFNLYPFIRVNSFWLKLDKY